MKLFENIGNNNNDNNNNNNNNHFKKVLLVKQFSLSVSTTGNVKRKLSRI